MAGGGRTRDGASRAVPIPVRDGDCELKTRIAVLALLSVSALAGSAEPVQAEVVRVVIESRTPISGDFGKAGPYELVSGRYFGELDPADPKNRIITDLQLAPRNNRGKVEYSATFALSRPVDAGQASGVLVYDTPNRGFGWAAGDPSGHFHLISGWQGDIPAGKGRQAAEVPVAKNPDGSSVTGPVLVRIVDPLAGPSAQLVRGLAVRMAAPTPVSVDTSKARLVRRRSDNDPGQVVPADAWSFGDCRTTPFPGVRDPAWLCLKAGVDPAYAYDLTYEAKDPAVLGIGFAAVRDLVSFLRDAPDTAAAPNPAAGQVRWTIVTGASQAGNFVRSFIHLGFNQAESGKRVFDGANPQIAARHVPLNVRFGVPGGAAGLYEPGSDGVLWWGWHDDKARGRGRTSLLARCERTNTCPKIVETFGSAEFWGLRMSADLVGFEAKKDIPLPANVRRYYSPSVTHAGGGGGFDPAPATPPPGCQLAQNPNPSSDTTRALQSALIDWVRSGRQPPPSQYPTIARGDLVPPTAKAMGFPAIPGAPVPTDKLNPLLIYDFGPGFRHDDVSGAMTTVPPAVRGSAPSLVPRVDQDGNEIVGIKSVQARAPLGSYLGWNVQAEGYYKGAGCGFAGGFIPFAATRAERIAAGDPRLSLEERYGDHATYVARVKAAAAQMEAERLLLPQDAARVVAQAASSKVLAGR